MTSLQNLVKQYFSISRTCFLESKSKEKLERTKKYVRLPTCLKHNVQNFIISQTHLEPDFTQLTMTTPDSTKTKPDHQ